MARDGGSKAGVTGMQAPLDEMQGRTCSTLDHHASTSSEQSQSRRRNERRDSTGCELMISAN